MKPGFRSKLLAETMPKRRWLVWRPLPYWSMYTGKPLRITVPVGFNTDLASIPKLLRSIIDVNGNHRESAALHDYLYATHGLAGLFTRKDCDKIFNEAMATQGIPARRRFIMYAGIRVGGWWGWRKHNA